LDVADTTGGDTTRTTVWGYDPAGRLLSTTAPDGIVTSQTWNTSDDVTTSTDPGGLTRTYRYNDHHQLLTTTTSYSRPPPPAAVWIR
jgi:YD repeat-containing protein